MINNTFFSYTVILLLLAFSFMTLFLSGSVLFDLFEIRERQGNYVLLVIWSNFINGILYLIAVFGLMIQKKWSFKVLVLSTAILVIALIGLFIHIGVGGLYETKTISALFSRLLITSLFALFAYLKFKK